MIFITLQYLPINFEVAFLRIKQAEIALTHYQYAFFIHVYTSILVLIAGLTQFSDFIRSKFRAMHRTLGKTYVLLVLIAASPSGLIMAYYANGGITSRIGFSILAVLWFIFTYKAYRYAVRKKWTLHKNYMYRSYALTLSAISLRLIKWGIVSTLALPPITTYRIVAWAGWIINLAVIEFYIRRKEMLKSVSTHLEKN